MVKGSTFHCAVSPHSLKEEEEGKNTGTGEVNILRAASLPWKTKAKRRKRETASLRFFSHSCGSPGRRSRSYHTFADVMVRLLNTHDNKDHVEDLHRCRIQKVINHCLIIFQSVKVAVNYIMIQTLNYVIMLACVSKTMSSLQKAIVSQITIIFLFGETCFSRERVVSRLCVSAWIIRFAEQQSVRENGPLPPTRSYQCVLYVSPSHSQSTRTHCFTFLRCLSCAPLLTEWAEHH